jgi:hypothetical protein
VHYIELINKVSQLSENLFSKKRNKIRWKGVKLLSNGRGLDIKNIRSIYVKGFKSVKGLTGCERPDPENCKMV